MSITTISSQDFVRDLAQVKRATAAGPVFVIGQSKPSIALLKTEDYYKLAGEMPRSLLDIMDSLPGGEFEFELPRLDNFKVKPAGLE